MLSIQNVFKAYDKPVLENFSYEFPDKGLFVIRGSSGIGKTTLLRLIAGLEKPDHGKICRKSDETISFVFQEARLAPYLTLLDNVLLVKKERDPNRASEILNELGLEDSANKFPDELSGGMKLRGSIARSLYYGGDIYLWDEPTKELDPENRKKIIDKIQALSEEKLMIVVTHDPELCCGTEIVL